MRVNACRLSLFLGKTRPQAQLASLHRQRVKSSAGSPDRPVMWTSIDRWLKTAAGLDVDKKFPLGKVGAPARAGE